MFTGIIRHTGSVLKASRSGLRVKTRAALGSALPAGESVAVSGVCLTLVSPVSGARGSVLEFGLSAVTAGKSNLSRLSPGDLVNLELPLRSGDFISGHIVSGHVERTIKFISLLRRPGLRLLSFELPEEGAGREQSVTLNGVSLTVSGNDPAAGLFTVAVIDETWKNTALSLLVPGTEVNFEPDYILKHALRPTQQQVPRKTAITMAYLAEKGFI